MILPASYGAALVLTLLSMMCWGSWANTFKLTGKWRFELFYYDYSLGVLIAAAIGALTFGDLGTDGLGFLDDLMHSGKRHLLGTKAAKRMRKLKKLTQVSHADKAKTMQMLPYGL